MWRLGKGLIFLLICFFMVVFWGKELIKYNKENKVRQLKNVHKMN